MRGVWDNLTSPFHEKYRANRAAYCNAGVAMVGLTEFDELAVEDELSVYVTRILADQTAPGAFPTHHPRSCDSMVARNVPSRNHCSLVEFRTGYS